MTDPGNEAPKTAKDSSRREFMQTAAVAVMTVGVASAGTMAVSASAVDRHAVIAALGDTLIPSEPGDPGYKDLEAYKITQEVLKALPGVSDADLELFNETAKRKFSGTNFLELSAAQRAQYLRLIIDGSAATDSKELENLRRVYQNTRRRVFNLYYSNFPEHEWPRDKNGVPILKAGDEHQITNPNTKQLITAWDQIGFIGALTWEQEERHRNIVKKIHWHEHWSPLSYPEKPGERE